MHMQVIRGCISLVINGLNYAALYYRLYLIYYVCNYLGTIKTDPIMYSWFKKTYKPLVPSDSLKLYIFIYNSTLRFSYNREALLNWMLSPNN